MEFLGVGPTELLFIIVIALIVLGPKDLAKTGSTVGKWLNSLIQSDTWKLIQKTSKELRHLPTQLMLDDNYEKALMEEKQRPPAQTNAGTWAGHTGTEPTPPQTDPSIDSKNENMIHPPITVDGPPVEAPKSAQKKSAAVPRKKTTPAKKKTVKSAPRKKSNA